MNLRNKTSMTAGLLLAENLTHLWRNPVAVNIPPGAQMMQKALLLMQRQTLPDALTVTTNIIQHQLPGQIQRRRLFNLLSHPM